LLAIITITPDMVSITQPKVPSLIRSALSEGRIECHRYKK